MRGRLADHEEQERAMKTSAIIFVMLWVIANGTNGAELGRLFYTPQQRSQLESQQETGDTAEGVKRNYIIVNGVIQKQGGNRIVWLNGTQQPATYGNETVPSTVPVTVPGKSQPVQVKVGQRLLLDQTVPEEK
jgi:hypothetical protein